MIPSLIILLFGISSYEDNSIISEECALIEENHIYNIDGSKHATFINFYEWWNLQGSDELVIRDWIFKDNQIIEQTSKGFQCIVFRENLGKSFKITAPFKRVVYTFYDKEVANRNVAPVHERNKIFRHLVPQGLQESIWDN